MDRKLRTGVVGAGVFGAHHAAKHAAAAEAEFIGVFDIDGARAAALADRHGVKKFSTLDDLVEAVDAVAIASPAPTHYRLARLALERARHVYVEKPLALDLEEADHLIALAQERSLVLQVGHQERYFLAGLGHPRAGSLPRRLEMSRCGPPSRRGEDVSVVLDLMIHDLDVARLFGFEHPLTAAACGDRNQTIATLTFDGGRECSFIASRRADHPIRTMTAIYSDGVVDIDFLNRRCSDTTPGGARPVQSVADPLRAGVDAFLSSILTGAPSLADGKAGRGALEWALFIEDARERLNAGVFNDERLIA